LIGSEQYERSLAELARLNSAILKNKYNHYPVDSSAPIMYEPVGRGGKSYDGCGVWRSDVMCHNVEGHEGKKVKGEDATGKKVVRRKHWFCDDPKCTVCFLRGWAVRRARALTAKMTLGEGMGFGKVEHIIVSAPLEYAKLDPKRVRALATKAMVRRGVKGGGEIFHGYALNRVAKNLSWRMHFHVLGWLESEYKCRDCPKAHVSPKGGVVCEDLRCRGFEARTRRWFEKDGFIVRVLPERKTVMGTAWYQLSHATIKSSAFNRSHVITYFGVCANRRFGSRAVVEPCVDVCEACGSEMERVFYVGSKRIPKDLGDPEYKAVFLVAPEEFCDWLNYNEYCGFLVGSRERRGGDAFG